MNKSSSYMMTPGVKQQRQMHYIIQHQTWNHLSCIYGINWKIVSNFDFLHGQVNPFQQKKDCLSHNLPSDLMSEIMTKLLLSMDTRWEPNGRSRCMSAVWPSYVCTIWRAKIRDINKRLPYKKFSTKLDLLHINMLWTHVFFIKTIWGHF